MIDLQEQIICVDREIRLRQSVYPRFIASGKMTPVKAATEIARMEAVRDTLIRLRDGGGPQTTSD